MDSEFCRTLDIDIWRIISGRIQIFARSIFSIVIKDSCIECLYFILMR